MMGRALVGAKVDEEVLREIKRIILEEAGRLGVRVERVILFGSRARGEAREDSDWDILVVVEGGLDWRVRRRLSINVRRRLYPLLSRPIDLLIEDMDMFRERSRLAGSLEETIMEEGVTA